MISTALIATDGLPMVTVQTNISMILCNTTVLIPAKDTECFTKNWDDHEKIFYYLIWDTFKLILGM